MSNRVMVVDDEAGVRKLAEHLLVKEGYDVIAVPDAEAALALYKPGMYDCLVVDFRLGKGKTGVDFIREIRQKDKNVGVVMTTGTVDLAELAVEGLSVWSCIRKPYEGRILTTKVEEACELARMDEGKMASLSTRMQHETDRVRELRRDLRAETRIVPGGIMGTI